MEPRWWYDFTKQCLCFNMCFTNPAMQWLRVHTLLVTELEYVRHNFKHAGLLQLAIVLMLWLFFPSKPMPSFNLQARAGAMQRSPGLMALLQSQRSPHFNYPIRRLTITVDCTYCIPYGSRYLGVLFLEAHPVQGLSSFQELFSFSFSVPSFL